MIYISKAAVRITVNLLAILWVGQIPNIDRGGMSQNKYPAKRLRREKKFRSSIKKGTGLERGKIYQVAKIHAIPTTPSNNLLAHP